MSLLNKEAVRSLLLPKRSSMASGELAQLSDSASESTSVLLARSQCQADKAMLYPLSEGSHAEQRGVFKGNVPMLGLPCRRGLLKVLMSFFSSLFFHCPSIILPLF